VARLVPITLEAWLAEAGGGTTAEETTVDECKTVEVVDVVSKLVTPPEVWVKVTGQTVVEEWTTTVVYAVVAGELTALDGTTLVPIMLPAELAGVTAAEVTTVDECKTVEVVDVVSKLVTPPVVWVKVTGQTVVEEWTTTVVYAVVAGELTALDGTLVPITLPAELAGVTAAEVTTVDECKTVEVVDVVSKLVTPPDVCVNVTGQIVVEEWTMTVVIAVDAGWVDDPVTEIPMTEPVEEAGAVPLGATLDECTEATEETTDDP
jgi:hypothetical protein